MKRAKAAALKYESDKNRAPKVIAKAKGIGAKAIIQKAREFDVPLFANEELVNSLLELDLDAEIPVELYKTVAELFVWLTKQEQRLAS